MYDREGDRPLLNGRRTKNTENSGGFELIDREIGMCRPVSFFFLSFFYKSINYEYYDSLKTAFMKFMY